MAKGFRFRIVFFPFHPLDFPFDSFSRLYTSINYFFSMKKLLPFLVASIIPALPALAEPNLGDWANRHRLADNLCKLGDHEEAIKQYELVLKGRLPFQGKKHRDIGVTHNNTGVAYYYLGETNKAKKAYEKAMESLLPALGAKHRDVLTVQTNLAFVEESTNQFKKAQKTFEECIKSKLPMVGAKHTEIADCREGLALTLEGQEKHEKALEQINLALVARVERLGEMHTDVGASYACIALILLNQGKFDKADKMDEKARKILSTTKGLYPPNRNQVSRFNPGPAELLRAKSKSLRIP